MRFLGIDYGTKKIGIALSDKSGKFAFPHSVIYTTYDVVQKIKKICEENDVSKIILGRPGGYKGDEERILAKVEGFGSKLKKHTNLTVVYESEVLTTKQAERPLRGEKTRSPVANKRKNKGESSKNLDASAAALILQSWLDRT